MVGQVDKYKLIEPIGGGGAGSVYLAEEQLPENVTRAVAIKLLPTIAAENKVLREKFLAETKALVALSGHPNIVTFLNFGIDNGTPWIAMDVVKSNLAQMITDKSAEACEVANMLTQIAAALSAMHEHDPPIVHHDIKPANILVDEFGKYKVTDFGLATIAESQMTYGIVTVRYAAPEALSNEFGAVGPATDLYALGHIAYEMALGEQAYRRQFPAIFDQQQADQAANPAKWMAWHCSIQAPAPSIRQALPDFPEPLANVIAKLMAKPLEQRYSSARQLLDDLKNLPEGAAATQREEPAIGPSTRPQTCKNNSWKQIMRKNPLLSVAALVMSLVLVGVLIIALLEPPPEIVLSQQDPYHADISKIAFSGRIENWRDDTGLILETGAKFTDIEVHADGTFDAKFTVDRPSKVEGQLHLHRDRQVLTSVPIVFQRIAPKKVSLTIRTEPAIADVLVKVQNKDGSVSAQKTDADGNASLSVQYGQFRMRLEHEDYQVKQVADKTGYDPEKTIVVKLLNLYEDVVFAVKPAAASVLLALADGSDEQAIELDDTGAAKARLLVGQYRFAVSLDEYEPKVGTFNVARGVNNRFAKVLRKKNPETPQVPLAGVLGQLPPLDAIEQHALAALSNEDFLKYMKHNAPLAQLTFEWPRESLPKLRVRGVVLNQTERKTLLNRMKNAMFRLDVEEVRIAPKALTRTLQRRLRGMELKRANVRDYKRTGSNNVYLRIEYVQTEGFTKGQVEQLAHKYVFDPTLVVAVEYTD